jgi:hypothetical protein
MGSHRKSVSTLATDRPARFAEILCAAAQHRQELIGCFNEGGEHGGQSLKVGSACDAVRVACRVIKVTGAHSTIKIAPRMTKL